MPATTSTGTRASTGRWGFGDVSDIFGAFSDLFGSFFGQAGGGRTRRGASLRVEARIPFETVVEGGTHTLSIRRRVHCDTCEGTGSEDRSPPVACGTCGGYGYVQTSQGFFSMRRACPRCGGDGNVVEKPCRACRGDGLVMGRREIELDIPTGIFDGVTLRVPGEGEPDRRTACPATSTCASASRSTTSSCAPRRTPRTS